MSCNTACMAVFMQISKKYTHYGAIILFMYFGLRMLYDVAFGGESVGHPFMLLLSIYTGTQGSHLQSATKHRPMMISNLKDQPPDLSGDTLRS